MESDSRKQRVSWKVNDGIYNAVWGFGAESGTFALRMRALVLRGGSRDDPLGICALARPGRDRHRTRTRSRDLVKAS